MSAPTTASSDRIEKSVILDAPRSRVWRALSDARQFGSWFGVRLASPFVAGAEVTASFTSSKYAHLTLHLWIEAIEPEHHFAFRWHPYAIEEGVDYTAEPTTLVSFTLEEVGDGTRLSIVESGFDAIPESRRATAFAMNSKGWDAQSENIRRFLAANA